MIKDIYKIQYMKDQWAFAGTLRNERRFELKEEVFFAINKNEIAKGTIVGVELPLEQYPDYIYKVELADELVVMHGGEMRKELNCDKIFKSIGQAEESAKKHLDHMYDIQKQEIVEYFKRFKGSTV